jgi:hypothetical protein
MAEMLRASGAVVSVEPSPPEFAMPTAISLVSLDNEEPAPAAPAPAGTPARGVTALDDSRFQAPPIAQQSMELDAPAAPARPAPSYQPPPAADAPARPSARHATAPAPVEEPDEDDEPPPAPIPGRLFQGQLRRNPALRLAIGIAFGLLIGYALSAPYQSRAERRVAQIRATANADRWRPLEEARANAARLDEEADDLASSAFLTTLAIWLGTAAAVTAGWYRLT